MVMIQLKKVHNYVNEVIKMHRLAFMIPDDTVKYILIDVIEIGLEQAPFVVFCY